MKTSLNCKARPYLKLHPYRDCCVFLPTACGPVGFSSVSSELRHAWESVDGTRRGWECWMAKVTGLVWTGAPEVHTGHGREKGTHWYVELGLWRGSPMCAPVILSCSKERSHHRSTLPGTAEPGTPGSAVSSQTVTALVGGAELTVWKPARTWGPPSLCGEGRPLAGLAPFLGAGGAGKGALGSAFQVL